MMSVTTEIFTILKINSADIRVGGAPIQTGGVIHPVKREELPFILTAEADQVGQEGSETFSVPLVVTSQTQPVSVFAADPAIITVNDRSGEKIHCVFAF